MRQVSVTLSKIMLPLLSDIIPRKRLFRLLDVGRKRPIIWICGPLGSGKTTLAASYLKNRNLPCLWYRMDEGDDDAGSFFYYLGLAAKKAAPPKSRSRRQLPLLSPENLLALPTFTSPLFRLQSLQVPVLLLLQGVTRSLNLRKSLVQMRSSITHRRTSLIGYGRLPMAGEWMWCTSMSVLQHGIRALHHLRKMAGS
jgi:hypothetical protein